MRNDSAESTRGTLFETSDRLSGCRFCRRCGGSAASAGHQIDICARLKQRIGRGLNAIQPRNGIEDNVLLFTGVVWNNLCQTEFAQRQLAAAFRPTDSGVINGIALFTQLNSNSEFNWLRGDSLLNFIE